ncbi:hypothetical protein [uncultured Paracoccus sp.]|nr:hypothetical protein [uncultured Paracoccus sp.]
MNTITIRPANLPQNPIAAAGIAVLTQMYDYYEYKAPAAVAEPITYGVAA